ncbi:MAG: ester cyclase [Pseudomonadota bacterium]
MEHETGGQYGADDDIIDYILGITYEIWEDGQIDLISRYYSDDCAVDALDGTSNTGQVVIDGTRAMLASFPDRSLLCDNIVVGHWPDGVAYSSHRLTSPMTHLGDHPFAAATGKKVVISNIADCVVEDGRIVREWLVRDQLSLVRQLELPADVAARGIKERWTEQHRGWLASEHGEVRSGIAKVHEESRDSMQLAARAFAGRWLDACWGGGDDSRNAVFAPYATLYRSPIERYHGRSHINAHYARWQSLLDDPKFTLDHCCAQPTGNGGEDIAVRWRVAGTLAQDFEGAPANGQPVLILGVTHLRQHAGRVTAEWTVFDQLAVLAQVI